MLFNDNSSKNVIELKEIRKTYDNKNYVLDGVNFSVEKGEVIIIEGESGSGKSTLMNILGLLDDYNEGEYLMYGEKISKKEYNRARAAKIGFVFQAYHLIDSINVKENIMLPFLYNGKEFGKNDKKYYDMLIDQFGLRKLEMKKAGTLSGGEKQRVAIARAMIKNPDIIIADEPTGNLDHKNTKIVIDAFRQLKSDGKSIIIVTHNMNIANKDDRRLILKDGKLN